MILIASFVFLALAMLAAFTGVVLVYVVETAHAYQSAFNTLIVPWDEKWPPISEDEFMRRCPPGTNRERALKVRRIISDQLGIEYERVYPEQRFVDDIGLD